MDSLAHARPCLTPCLYEILARMWAVLKRIWRVVWCTAARIDLIGSRGRIFCFRLAGIEIGSNCHFAAGIRFVYCRAQFGSNVYVGPECFFEDSAPLIVESGVAIGPRCIIATGTHELGPSARRAGAVAPKPITVGTGSAVASGVIVVSGVTVGPGCVIAAGSVVTQDCEPDSGYAGVPAVLKRRL